MSSSRTPDVVLDDLAFPEGPRWHDGRLWFSDQHDHRVIAMDTDGKAETIVEVAAQPSGLGWLPDGRLLVVSMLDRRVLRLERDGALALHADLAALAPGQCNDMVVDAAGRAYVGNFGFDMSAGEPPRDTCMIAIEPDGTARVAAEGLAFPNGSTISPDGRTFLVGESVGRRISAFDVDNGRLSNHRVWAELREAKATVDGMCLDAEGAIWAACPYTGRVLRVREGGEVVEEIKGSHGGAFACMLGGPDRRTLYVCTAPSTVPDETRAARQGRIEAVEVDVPGVGLP
jgi:sugar lactone lactonase YvrE